jgi:hypothetical protein
MRKRELVSALIFSEEKMTNIFLFLMAFNYIETCREAEVQLHIFLALSRPGRFIRSMRG